MAYINADVMLVSTSPAVTVVVTSVGTVLVVAAVVANVAVGLGGIVRPVAVVTLGREIVGPPALQISKISPSQLVLM